MDSSDAEASEPKPFLARFATPRISTNEALPGWYCRKREVWVVEEADGGVPLVEAARDLAEIVTKTKVEAEVDDTRNLALLELTTKTAADIEHDDQSRSAQTTFELMTKTMVAPEQDHVDPSHVALLDLATKTEADLERDDVSKGLELFEALSWDRSGALSAR